MDDIDIFVTNAYSHLDNGNVECAEKILTAMKEMERTPK